MNNRLIGLDAIRGVAVLMVLIYHYGELKIFPHHFYINYLFGMFGVDLFYVLSGFFITKAIISPSTWNPLSFFEARVRRIYPAYLFSLLIFLFLSSNSFDYNYFLITLLHILMLHNLFPGIGGAVNGPFWTLGVEFPYYFLMLALAPFIRNLKGFFLVNFLFILISIVWRASVYQYTPDLQNRFFLSTQILGCLDAFALGGISAYFFKNSFSYSKNMNIFIFVIGITLTTYNYIFIIHHFGDYWTNSYSTVFWRTQLALGFALIIFSITYFQQYRFIVYSGLPWLGKISFSLYIYHMFIGEFIVKNFKNLNFHWLIYFSVSFGISLLISWLSWKFIETRFHQTNTLTSPSPQKTTQ